MLRYGVFYCMYVGILLLLVLAWRLSIGFVDSRVGLLGAGIDAASTNMALQYTSLQLLSLKRNYYLSKDTYDHCDRAGLLRPKRYIHRSSGRKYVSFIVFFHLSFELQTKD
ncbi:hypothetical protein DPX16_3575 [Anabarilius grahami]|uniref:Uncharacterized protein n=1 Tax=Anabarilius grahami TaxID=495550 RepID=A0A3N0XQY4_ANAGA|nr:hypothetical protein DPX16_3575 [Anabarilius grahami]